MLLGGNRERGVVARIGDGVAALNWVVVDIGSRCKK